MTSRQMEGKTLERREAQEGIGCRKGHVPERWYGSAAGAKPWRRGKDLWMPSGRIHGRLEPYYPRWGKEETTSRGQFHGDESWDLAVGENPCRANPKGATSLKQGWKVLARSKPSRG